MSKEIEITKEDLEKIRQEGLRFSAEITKSMKRMSVHDTIPELKREIDRLTAALKEKEAECERWHKAFTHYHVNNGVLEESHRAVNAQLKIEGKRAQDMANLAASRLADQEAIERHTAKRVAGTNCGRWPDMTIEDLLNTLQQKIKTGEINPMDRLYISARESLYPIDDILKIDQLSAAVGSEALDDELNCEGMAFL